MPRDSGRPSGGRLLPLLLAIALAGPAVAADFYVDPLIGSPGGDGSAGNPWRTLQEVIDSDLIETRQWESYPYQEGLGLVIVNEGAPVKAGDTLWLRSGYHGEVVIHDAYNAATITISAQPGQQPLASRLELRSVQNWIVRGLSISPSYADPPIAPGTIASIEDHNFFGPSWDVELADSEIFTVADAAGWGAAEWIDASSGIGVDSDRVTVRGNTVRNVRFGITADGAGDLISRNLVDGFSADGMRGLGDDSVYEYNRIQNCYVSDAQGDPNHDDGFQSWSLGPGGPGTGEVRNVVLRGNVVINYLDAANPLNTSMQGIGCFDGMFVDWVVENNVVITDHWHGISFYGMIDSRIVGNTVIDVNGSSPGPPWILVTDNDGVPSQNVVVRNNLATDYVLDAIALTADHNLEFELGDAGLLFVTPPYDLRLLPGTAAVDSGSPDLAPPIDVDGIPRPQGAGFDLGAHERCPGCVFLDGFESGDTSAWDMVLP
jgi:Right handed beta helix region